MKILVIGSGGREHALAWKLAQSPRVSQVVVAPGNAGTAMEAQLKNVAVTDIPGWIKLAREEQVHFTVVGPEAPLAAGVVDAFTAEELAIFGPTKGAAQLESSKDFAKRFLLRHSIPTARYQTFSDAVLAHRYVDQEGAPIVIKADGLAAGKGVVVAMSVEEAHAAIDQMLDQASPPQPSNESPRVVIEECMPGEEASFIVLANGKQVLPLATSQDHKRLLDGDQGPNTGGMGAYSPAPVVSPDVHARVMREIVQPTLAGLQAEGLPYCGFLYVGLMINSAGLPRVVEFNCRLGDPETQPILMRLRSDLSELIEAALNGKLNQAEANWDRRVAISVVLAAAGYPASPRKMDPIHGLPNITEEDVHIFHAATAAQNGQIVTAGGRVLCVTALGDSLQRAQESCYKLVSQISFAGCQYRRDIGNRGLNRNRN